MSTVGRWGIPGNLQEWSSHCYFSGNLGPPAGPEPSSFPSPAPALCCPLEAQGGSWQKSFKTSLQMLCFPEKKGFPGRQQSLYLSQPDSQGGKRGPWQSCHWSHRLADVIGNLWGCRGAVGTWELNPQTGRGRDAEQATPSLHPAILPGPGDSSLATLVNLSLPGKPHCASSSIGVYVTFISSA